MSSYHVLAGYYDRLIGAEEQSVRCNRYMELFRHFSGALPRLVLDIACGSLAVSIEMMRAGTDVIGVDASEEFLTVAAQRAADAGFSPLLLCQDMRELDLYGTVGGAVCAMDGLNHILTTGGITLTLTRLHLFIEPGGLFIFDVNMPYKHCEILANNAFVFEEKDFFCVWQNEYLPARHISNMQIDFFVNNESGYHRFTDFVRERAYSEKTLNRLLAQCGFETIAVFDDLSGNPPRKDSEKLMFVTRRL